MNAASTSRTDRGDPLLPKQADGLGAGALMAVLVHALLLMALAFGVNWHASEPEGVTAELWSAVPQVAAPTPTQPPPEPEPVKKEAPKPEPPKPAPPEPKAQPQRDAEIALEKARQERKQREEEEAAREKARREKEQAEREKAEKERAEKEQAEKERQARAEADAKRKKEEQARLAKQAEEARKEYLARVMGATGTGAPTSTGTAARDAGPSASYAGRIKARIKPNIVLTDDVPGNPTAEVELRVAPDGTIVGRKIVKSSGVQAWDDAVLRAIDRTEVLPRDVDGRVPATMVIAFRPKD